MPFMHSENLAAQEQSVALFKAKLPASNKFHYAIVHDEIDNLRYAIEHHETIILFGRFPHRNKLLGRQSTPEEIAFLGAGGFNP
jgi:uncharacterized protein (DUF924 family)